MRSFLDRMEPSCLMAISSLNSRLKFLVDYYSLSAWNFNGFVGLYVHKPGSLLALMDGRNAMIHGEAAYRFFLRQSSAKCTLEICATVSKIYYIQRFLEDDGYDLVTPEGTKSLHHTIRHVLYKTYCDEPTGWDLSGERTNNLRPPVVYDFYYVKGYGFSERTICLRLVRCEPYRYVLRSSLSEYFNVIRIPSGLNDSLSLKVSSLASSLMKEQNC